MALTINSRLRIQSRQLATKMKRWAKWFDQDAKTIVVEVTRRTAHPVYKRIVKKRKKFYAHDEEQSRK